MSQARTEKPYSRITAPGWGILFFSILGIVLARLFGIIEIMIFSVGGIVFVAVAFAVSRYGAKINVACKIIPARVWCYESAVLELRLNPEKNISRLVGVSNLNPENPYEEPALFPLLPAENGEENSAVERQIPTAHRGRLEIGPLIISYLDPFGIVRTTLRTNAAAELIVHPYIYNVSPPDAGHRQELNIRSEQINQGSEFHSLKEYHPGDDLRLIHWSSSAKLGELVIRQNTAEESNALKTAIFLDNRPGVDADRFENMVSSAASFAYACRQRGDEMMLAAADGQTAGSHKHDLMDCLALIEQMEDTAENQTLSRQALKFINVFNADLMIVILGRTSLEEEQKIASRKTAVKSRRLILREGAYA